MLVILVLAKYEHKVALCLSDIKEAQYGYIRKSEISAHMLIYVTPQRLSTFLNMLVNEQDKLPIIAYCRTNFLPTK